MLYYRRWTIEKSFNNSQSDFTERKAWSSNLNALNSQIRFTAMAYNIMRIFEETSKTKSLECIHPSDKKYTKMLDKRQQIAQKKGGFVNPLFFYARITRICSFTIRSLPGLLSLLNRLPADSKPELVRGDIGFGTDTVMSELNYPRQSRGLIR